MDGQSIFEHYRSRIIREYMIHNPHGIRYNSIQYICQFPGINPVEMAASLQNDGFTILFDDSSISAKENAKNRVLVSKFSKSKWGVHK